MIIACWCGINKKKGELLLGRKRLAWQLFVSKKNKYQSENIDVLCWNFYLLLMLFLLLLLLAAADRKLCVSDKKYIVQHGESLHSTVNTS